jgi:branched-chain amino acid transport system permease protein
LPAARLQKIYLGLFTLAFGELLRLIATNETELTNGPSGLSLARIGFPLGMESMFQILLLILALLVVCYLGLSYFSGSTQGLRVQAIRDDQLAADARGVNVAFGKLLAFTISSVIMAMAGAVFVFQNRYVSPDMLRMDYSFQFMVMGLFGGINTLIGPIIGAVCITFLLEILRSWEELRLVLLGLMVCLNLILLPAGLIGTPWRYLATRRVDNLRKRFGTQMFAAKLGRGTDVSK